MTPAEVTGWDGAEGISKRPLSGGTSGGMSEPLFIIGGPHSEKVGRDIRRPFCISIICYDSVVFSCDAIIIHKLQTCEDNGQWFR